MTVAPWIVGVVMAISVGCCGEDGEDLEGINAADVVEF